METQEYKAWWLTLMDSDTEVEFYGGGYPFFGTEEELEQHIEIVEREESEIHECNVSVIFTDYAPEEIAQDIIRQRLYFCYRLPEDYDTLDIESELFHMYDVCVDLILCSKIKPHLHRLMKEKEKKREAELSAYYRTPTKCNKYGQVTL